MWAEHGITKLGSFISLLKGRIILKLIKVFMWFKFSEALHFLFFSVPLYFLFADPVLSQSSKPSTITSFPPTIVPVCCIHTQNLYLLILYILQSGSTDRFPRHCGLSRLYSPKSHLQLSVKLGHFSHTFPW